VGTLGHRWRGDVVLFLSLRNGSRVSIRDAGYYRQKLIEETNVCYLNWKQNVNRIQDVILP
jgi:hypothetical protein